MFLTSTLVRLNIQLSVSTRTLALPDWLESLWGYDIVPY